MTYCNLIKVSYSYETGDETLPHLVDLVSDAEDENKSLILAYLHENCIAACPGTSKPDIINNEKRRAAEIFIATINTYGTIT